MKRIYLTIISIFIASNVHAVTIDIGYEFAAIANGATLSGTFTTNGADSNTASIIDNSAATYLLPASSGSATIDINSFGDGSNNVEIYTGTGIDLSIFFVDASPHIFDLQISSGGSTYTRNFSSLTHANWAYTGYCLDLSSTPGCEANSNEDLPIYVMGINLDAYFTLGQSPIDSVLLNVSDASAVPSLIGAHHLAPVPLPLPIILFSSGLALLGFVGRKKR